MIDKFEIDSPAWDVRKGESGRPRAVTKVVSYDTVLEYFTNSPQRSTTECAYDTLINDKTLKSQVESFHSKIISDDDPDRRFQFRE